MKRSIKIVALIPLLLLFFVATAIGFTGINGSAKADEPEVTFELLGQGEALRYNGSKPSYTYTSETRSGTLSFAGDKKAWFNFANLKDYVVKEDDSIESLSDQTLRLTVSFSNVTALDENQNYWVGLTLVDGDVAEGASSLGSNYYVLRHQKNVSSGKYMYQGRYGTFSGGGNFLGDADTKYALTENDTVMTLEIKCGEQLKGWLDGKEITDNFATYNGTSLPNVGLYVNYMSVSFTISAELVGVKGWEGEDLQKEIDVELTAAADPEVIANPEEYVSFDSQTKSGYLGGIVDGETVTPVSNGVFVGGNITFNQPDKVVLDDDSYADYSTVKQISVSAIFSDIIAGDGAFDANNTTEAVGLKIIEDGQEGWIFISPAAIFGNFGGFHPTSNGPDHDKGIFEKGSGSGVIRFTSSSPWGDDCVALKAVITVAQGDEDGKIEIYVNGTLAKTIGYYSENIPKVRLSVRGVYAKVSDVTYSLSGIKDIHYHTLQTVPAVPATCTEDGLTEGAICTVCGDTVIAQQVVPAAHTLEKTEAVTATCTATGNIEYWTCTVCGKIFSDEEAENEITLEETITAKIPHDTFVVERVEPTCTNDGNIQFWFCTVCGKIFSDEDCENEISEEDTVLKALGHTPAAAVEENRKAPTCTEKGSYDNVVYCSVCGEELSRETIEIDALGHTPAAAVEENRKAPTCTEKGSYDNVVYCSVCGEELSRETIEIDALGHTPAAAVEENRKAPTCTEKGSYDNVVYCSVCGEELSKETIEIDALGHTPAAAVEENRKAPTCTENGSYDLVVYCSVCGVELSRETIEIDALGHTPVEAVEENRVAPTCTEKGSYDSVVYCSVCGEELSRETVEIDTLGHDFGELIAEVPATCTETGVKEHKDCARCGKHFDKDGNEIEDLSIAATGHTASDWIIDKEPTTEEEGKRHKECTVCGEILQEESIPKLEKSGGCGSAIESGAEVFAIIALAVALFGIMAIKRRKEH